MKELLKSMFSDIFGNGFYQDIRDAILFDVSSGGLWNVVSSIYQNTILPIGYTLLCLYFLLEMIEKSTQETLNFEHLIRLFIKLIIGKMLMDNALTILFGLISFSNSIINSVINNFNIPTSVIDIDGVNASVDAISKWDILGMIGLWARLIVPYLGNMAVNVVASVICWSRSINIIVRMMMAPLAMPDIFSDGTRGNGFRYLKKFLAVCLQGAIILATVIAMNVLSAFIIQQSNPGIINSIDDIPWTFMLDSLIMSFTTVTLIQESKEWANDVVGV